MLKIFRRLRQNLLTENKFSKYLIYAIGEIILVVIGILLALQINNWNEARKNRNFEEEILSQIQANLIKDKLALTTINANFEKAIHSSQKILESNWTSQDQDSLQYWLGDVVQFDRFQPLTNAYEVLKSKGLDQVQNKQLRFLLGTYYDDQAKNTIESIRDVEEIFKNDWIPILRKEALDMKFKSFVILKNNTLFSEESMAKNLLRINIDNYRGGSIRIGMTVDTITEIQNIIAVELKD